MRVVGQAHGRGQLCRGEGLHPWAQALALRELRQQVEVEVRLVAGYPTHPHVAVGIGVRPGTADHRECERRRPVRGGADAADDDRAAGDSPERWTRSSHPSLSRSGTSRHQRHCPPSPPAHPGPLVAILGDRELSDATTVGAVRLLVQRRVIALPTGGDQSSRGSEPLQVCHNQAPSRWIRIPVSR
jgi:hypothetical protein